MGLGSQSNDGGKKVCGDGHNGETGLAEKKEFGEFLVGFELIERHRLRECTYGREYDRGPLFSLRGGGIREGDLCDFGQSDDGSLIHAVVVEDRVAEFHLAEEISGLVVAYTVPDHLFILEELREGIGGGFLFNKPMGHEEQI